MLIIPDDKIEEPIFPYQKKIESEPWAGAAMFRRQNELRNSIIENYKNLSKIKEMMAKFPKTEAVDLVAFGDSFDQDLIALADKDKDFVAACQVILERMDEIKNEIEA